MPPIMQGLTPVGEAQPSATPQRIYNKQPGPIGSTRNPHLESYLGSNPVRDYGVAPRDVVNSVAEPAEARQATLAAENAPLRVIYGRQRVGAQIATAIAYQGDLILLCVWGHGEIDSIESVQVDDKTPAAGITFTHYTGTPGQTADALLVSAYAAQTPAITYADTLPNIAYSVARIPAGTSSGFPRITAVIKGRKLYDSRSTLTVWSDNPALALADFITNTVYGLGKNIDWNTVTTVANFNDALVGVSPNQEKHRILNLVVDVVSPIQNWLSTLGLYAGCFLIPDGNVYKLLANTTAASVHSFTAANILEKSLKLKKRGVQQIPTVTEVIYTDTSVLPWKDGSAIVYAAGVLAGTTPRRESRIQLPGLTRYTQAVREATERMNLLTLNDLTCSFTAFDDALKVQKGDVVTVTHPIGLANKLMRVMNITDQGSGRWGIDCEEYDPAAYSTTVVGTPTFTDTNLPSPAAPPIVSGLVLSEEVYQLENGTYASRVRANWSAAAYPFLRHYRCELFDGGALIDTSNAVGTTYASPAIQQEKSYEFKIYAVSSLGASGAATSASITALGKQLRPGDVPLIVAFEAAGTIYLSWTAAIDIDIWRYELRYGSTSTTWETATLLDRVDALSYKSTGIIPTGTWKVFIKAIDSVRLDSVNAASVTVTVTLDSAAFLADTANFSNPTLTNMQGYTLAPTDTNKYWITEDGTTFGTRFTGLLDTYTSPLGSYASTLASTWVSESYDYGLSITGAWRGTVTSAAVVGPIVTQMELSTDNSAWNSFTSLTANASARFARIKGTAAVGSVLKMTSPTMQVRVDAIPREETGVVTTLASGGKLVQLANKYAAAKSIQITPVGNISLTGSPDRILISSETGLQFTQTMTGTGNLYVYQSFSYASRVIASGDYLEYDIFVDGSSAASNAVGGMNIYFTDATNGIGLNIVDQDSFGIHNFNPSGTKPHGIWYSRKLSLAPALGKTADNWTLTNESNINGNFSSIYKNIRITDGVVTTRQTIWSSGEPTVNANFSQFGATNIKMGPSNSFLVFVFNGTTQQAAETYWSFKGV